MEDSQLAQAFYPIFLCKANCNFCKELQHEIPHRHSKALRCFSVYYSHIDSYDVCQKAKIQFKLYYSQDLD